MTSNDSETLPALWEVYEIAALVGWERRRMQRLLAREMKIAQKRGGRWVVSTDALRADFPEAYRELEKRREVGTLPQRQPARPPKVKTAA